MRTTEQLFKDKQIQSYLTSEQNVILYELLKIENYDVKLKHWTDLLDGKLKLQSSLIENDHSVDENNKDEVIDEFLKMDLQNLQERLSSDGFLSALSLKIRYCLWEQPLRIWLQDDLKDYKLLRIYNEYKTSTLEANDDDNDDMLDDIKYVIMDLAKVRIRRPIKIIKIRTLLLTQSPTKMRMIMTWMMRKKKLNKARQRNLVKLMTT